MKTAPPNPSGWLGVPSAKVFSAVSLNDEALAIRQRTGSSELSKIFSRCQATKSGFLSGEIRYRARIILAAVAHSYMKRTGLKLWTGLRLVIGPGIGSN